MKAKEMKKALLALLPEDTGESILDVSEEKCLKKYRNVTRCTESALPFANGSFDCAFSLDGSVPLAELHRVLKTKGILTAGVLKTEDIPSFRTALKSLFDVNAFYVDGDSIYYEAEKREVK